MGLDALLDGMARILNEGASTTSYKWLLLWSVLDSAPVQLATGNGQSLDMRLVGESAIRAVQPQLREYPPLGRSLRQGSLPDDPLLYRSSDLVPDGVAWDLAQWPLPRIQHVPNGLVEVLWMQLPQWEAQLAKDRNSRIPRKLFSTDARGVPAIAMVDIALQSLVRLSPLVKPLIEIRWRDDVRRWNKSVATDDENWSIDRYLFPDSARISLAAPAVRDLKELQHHRCLWCGRELAGSATQTDHVVPWSRTLNNSVENLAVTDKRCNSVKSDRLISARLGRKWADHVNAHRQDLRSIARNHNLPTSPEESLAWLLSLTTTAVGDIDYFDVVHGEPVIRKAVGSQAWPIDRRWISLSP